MKHATNRGVRGLLAALLTVLMIATSAAPVFACTPEQVLDKLGITIVIEPGNGGNTGDTRVKGKPGFIDVSAEYTALNNFRTEKNVWYWNQNNITKTYFNTNSSNKLGKLSRDTALENTAKVRAKEIVQKFSHTRPNGTRCFTAYPNYSALGENIAYGQRSVNEVMEAFKETNENYSGQGHRRNMLNPNFNCVGLACYRDANGTLYWAQCFGRK